MTPVSHKLHEQLTIIGWMSVPAGHSLAYWTMRLADELATSARYDAMRRQLLEAAWEGIRPATTSTYAVSASLPVLVEAILDRNAHRLNGRHEQSVRELRKAIDDVASLRIAKAA